MKVLNTLRLLVSVILSFALSSLLASELLIENARVFTVGERGILENGYVLVRDGRIAGLGEQRDFSFDGNIIDARGKSVTPGLVNAYTHLGLVEINAVSHSVDYRTEDTLFGPSFQVAMALNPSSTAIPHNRINGLTHAFVVPEPGHQLFAGYGAAIRLGPDPEAMLIDEKLAMFVNLAAHGSKLSGGSRASAFAKLHRSLADAREYQQNRGKIREGKWREYFLPLHDLEALVPVVDGSKILVVTAHRASDIRQLLKLKKQFGLQMVLAGASEAWLLAEEIAAAGVAVIMDPMANLPGDFDQLAARLDAATRLQRAGVNLLFTGVAWRNTHSAYTVRQAAGNAVAHGLGEEDAIAAMTINPARVFGFDNDYGSIEEGKIADLVIWDGHPLELLTRADAVIINGEQVTMVSRATRLRDRYRKLDTVYPPAYRK